MKHPVLENRVRLIVWWLVWLFLGLGQSLLYYFAFNAPPRISVIDGILSFIFFGSLGLAFWYPFRFIDSNRESPAVLISNLMAAGVISVGLWILLTKFTLILILTEKNNFTSYWQATLPYRIGTGVFIYGLTVLSYYLFMGLTNLAEKNAREARLESLIKETELKMLRSQINPHFLFNSLNSISSLTITDPGKARTMVIKLSEFMRYSLSRKEEEPVSFRSELENLRLYLDIEKVRFGNKLTTDENVSRESLEMKIPVMLLQPLYENAVKHGVYESTNTVRISTKAELNNGFLVITVSNNFDPEASPSKGTGTGLLNVARRLELFYGNKAFMNTMKDNGVFTVNLFIPAENN